MSGLSRTDWRLGVAILALAVGTALTTAGALAAPARTFTNIAALQAHPEFFQNRQVVVQARFSHTSTGKPVLRAGGDELQVLYSGTPPPDGLVEARGEFWDIGGMHNDDPRLRPAVRQALGLNPSAAWPRSGALLALNATSLFPASPASAPSIRTIVLNPDQFVGQTVTVTGQFSGRNLLGELPDAPGLSQWDFVLRSTEAALWVTGVQPKGDGFNLDPGARVDTAHWLQVTGIVRQGRGLIWIETAKGGVKQGQAPTTVTTDQDQAAGHGAGVTIPAFPPPAAVFSAPTEGESDVPLTTAVRIQFSRDLEPSTIKGNVRIAYLTGQSVERGEPDTPTIGFTLDYVPERRELHIQFTQPLERFRTVRVELLPAILGADHQPLTAWTLSFTLGGS